MKRSVIVRTALFLLAALGTSYAADTTDSKKTVEFVKIDFRLNTRSDDHKNHFYWQTTDASYKDSFDAVSGASRLHSTKEFRAVSFDKSGKQLQAPKGLRSLCLFAVTSFDQLAKDDFNVSANGKKLTVTFSHRGIDYKIETDEKGYLSVPDGFYILLPVANPAPEAEQTEAGETPKETEDAPLPADTEIAEITFSPDKGSDELTQEYTGRLKLALSGNGILTAKGKLMLTEKQKSEEPGDQEKASDQEGAPAAPPSDGEQTLPPSGDTELSQQA